WGENILEVLSSAKAMHNDETLNKRRAALPDFDDRRPFIHRFAGDAQVKQTKRQLTRLPLPIL
ncbi:MAG: hypothetical protein SVR94_01535, partial [Pseudomonadota bacterium]|nr:hypothetical protein [Pseudomonadota bacterium]